MSTNAYPISAPVKFVGTGSIFGINTGDINLTPTGSVNIAPSVNLSITGAGSVTISPGTTLDLNPTGVLTIGGTNVTIQNSNDLALQPGGDISLFTASSKTIALTTTDSNISLSPGATGAINLTPSGTGEVNISPTNGFVVINTTGAANYINLISQAGEIRLQSNVGGNIVIESDGYTDFADKSIRNFVVSTTGALITSNDGTTLNSVTIGTTGQVLTVIGGVPTWQTPAGASSAAFHVNLTGSTSAAAAATFTTLTATWDESTAPDFDDGIFASGVFTVAATGVYDLSASLIFAGNNSGGGVTFTDAPTQGEAVRQLRLRNTTSGKTLAFATKQAEPFASNDTQLVIPGVKCSLNGGDTVAIQYRHDASASINIQGSAGNDTMGQTWFSAHRVR